MNTNQILNAVRAKTKSKDDTAMAASVFGGITYMAIKGWRDKGLPEDRVVQCAKILGIDAGLMLNWINAERTKNPEAKKAYERAAAALKSMAAMFTGGVIAFFALPYPDAHAAAGAVTGIVGGLSALKGLFILCQIELERLFWRAKRYWRHLLSLLALSFTPAAFADTYAGVTLGNSLYDVDFPGVEHGFDSENSQSNAIIVGSTINRFLSVEGEYAQLGTFWIRNNDHETDTTVQALNVSLVPRLGPVFVKLGAELWQMKTTFDGHPEALNGTGFVYGIGAEFALSRAVNLRIGFDKHTGIDDPRVNVNPGVTRSYMGLMFRL